jgi:hypothetical protein
MVPLAQGERRGSRGPTAREWQGRLGFRATGQRYGGSDILNGRIAGPPTRPSSDGTAPNMGSIPVGHLL